MSSSARHRAAKPPTHPKIKAFFIFWFSAKTRAARILAMAPVIAHVSAISSPSLIQMNA